MSKSGADLQLEVGQFSHPGRKRTNNEDWLGLFQPEDARRLAAKGSLFLVADGMGGHRSGELASRRAVDHVIRTYFDDATRDVAASLKRAIQAANRALHTAAAGARGQARCGTTLVAAVIRKEGRWRACAGARLWVANVGDSRAYLLRRRQLCQLSQDHSWAAEGLGNDGLGRHVVTRALGLHPHVEVDLFLFRLQPGDQILLCSDGLTGPLSDPEIQAIMERYAPAKAAGRLVEAANERGGPDNVSVLLVRLPGRTSDWQEALDSLLDRFRPERLEQAGVLGLVSPDLPRWALVALALLAVLSLVGLGFLLGRVLF